MTDFARLDTLASRLADAEQQVRETKQELRVEIGRLNRNERVSVRALAKRLDTSRMSAWRRAQE